MTLIHCKWKAVGKECAKSGEGNDADKIKYPSEKVVFTSSYFGAQNILRSLSPQTHSRLVYPNVQGTSICIMSFNPMTSLRSGEISILR